MKRLVLIADDEEALLEVFAATVLQMGHEVVSAENGEEALRMAQVHKPDLIVSDHMMPRRTGVELLRAVRADPALSTIPFVLISAARPKGAEEADLFVAKPATLEQFERALQSALEAAPLRDRSEVTARRPSQPERAFAAAGEELIAWVAHEIKTPLNIARMNTQLIQRRLLAAGDADESKRCATVLEQLDRMNVLVVSVLEAAQLSEGHLVLNRRPIDLCAYLAAVIDSWKAAAPEVQFQLAIPERELVLPLDADRVRQILDNVIGNAVKYGGPSRWVQVGAQVSVALVEVFVEDRGPGIPAAELPHLFERFRRAEGAAAQGHGLGLFIASELARLHGGALRVISETGAGTRFTLALPLSA